MTDMESLRDLYLTGQIWNIDDLVEANGVEGKIVRRGTNYVAFNDKDGKVHKAWLHEIKYRVSNKDGDTMKVDANNPKDAVKKALRKRFKDTGMITTRSGKEPFTVFDEPKGEFVDIDERRTKQDPDIKEIEAQKRREEKEKEKEEIRRLKEIESQKRREEEQRIREAAAKLKYESDKLKETEERLRNLEIERQQDLARQLIKEEAEQKANNLWGT